MEVGLTRQDRVFAPHRREIKKIALSIPTDLGRPFATWSLAKLADYLVAEGVVTDISHEGLRQLLREEAWRNYNVDDAKLRAVVNTANVA